MKITILITIIGSLLLGLVVPAEAAVVRVPRRIDGVLVKKGTENTWPVAVMIDNHTAARPQSGLQAASVVYETLAEGGIPRFMAIYAATDMKEVGPVRSTRPYFAKLAAEYGAAVAHAGGSPDGLKEVTRQKLFSFFALRAPYAKFFYRAHNGGVHGLYTSGAKLLAALRQAKATKRKPQYRPWVFNDGLPLAQRPNGKHGATVNLGYGRSYLIEYRYDKRNNRYLRYTGGRAHIDRTTRKQILVKNIIIMNVPKAKVLDRKGRLDIPVTGKGSGLLLNNGKVTKVTWSKRDGRGRTVFLNAKTKQEITLVRGNTWIEVVPQGHTVKAY